MKNFLYIASICATLLAGVTIALSQTNENAAIDSFITRRAKAEKAEEYSEARKVVRGDVNGDRRVDVTVLYTLEGFNGGNSHAQYLAIFLGGGKTFRNAANAPVGGKLNRSVDLVSVTAGKINLDTLGYRSDDPACCPTRKGKTHYIFTNGKLKEVK